MGNVNMNGLRLASARTSTSSSAPQPRETKAAGLQTCNEWDDKAIRKLVGEGTLAPRLKGVDRRSDIKGDCDAVECPICFLFFDAFNRSACCNQPICTECYLQIRPQNTPVACPFCSVDAFCAIVAPTPPAGAKDGEPRRRSRQDGFDEMDAGEAKDGSAEPKRAVGAAPPRKNVASIQERMDIEEQMQKQLVLARERGDSFGVADDATPAWAASSARRGANWRSRREMTRDAMLDVVRLSRLGSVFCSHGAAA